MIGTQSGLSRLGGAVSRCLARSARTIGEASRASGGTSVVEFAVSAPVLLGLLVPVADLGMAFGQRQQVEQAVQAGAQYASFHPWHSNAANEIADVVRGATSISGLSVTPAPYQVCGCPTGTSVTMETCGSTCANGQSTGYYVVVSAQAPYTATLPYSALPNQIPLTAQSTVRIR
jgi:Flp pilus assembly protein TadG